MEFPRCFVCSQFCPTVRQSQKKIQSTRQKKLSTRWGKKTFKTWRGRWRFEVLALGTVLSWDLTEVSCIFNGAALCVRMGWNEAKTEYVHFSYSRSCGCKGCVPHIYFLAVPRPVTNRKMDPEGCSPYFQNPSPDHLFQEAYSPHCSRRKPPENLDGGHLLAYQWFPRKWASSWDCIANTSALDCDCNKENKT